MPEIRTQGLKSNHTGAPKDFMDQLCRDLDRLNKGLTFLNHTFDATGQCWVAILVLSTEYFSKKHIVNIAGAGCRCEISSEWQLQPQDNLSFYTFQEYFSCRTRGEVAWIYWNWLGVGYFEHWPRKAGEALKTEKSNGTNFQVSQGKDLTGNSNIWNYLQCWPKLKGVWGFLCSRKRYSIR